jgi:hypothetical protein
LKFNRTFENGAKENGFMRGEIPLVKRLLTKLVHDILPTALASLIGGFLFTHFQLGQWGQASEPAAAQVAPASAETMQLLRDEHRLISDFVTAQLANEKKQLAAEDSARRVAVEPQPAAGAAAALRQPAIALTAARLVARGKSTVASVPLPPLVIAQAPGGDGAKSSSHYDSSSHHDSAARHDDSLLAKTIGIKDHVVAVTQRVVSAIGGIPSWIGAIGDRIGGDDANPRPPANLVSAS